MFVSKHGGQSEIVLRVKQGDNPTFGFLMPDHHLHAYFRFLVDHPELLSEENKTNSVFDAGGGGALSLLGSIYGSGEDEDGASADVPELKRNESDEAVCAVNVALSNGSEQAEHSGIVSGKDETVSRHSLASRKEKVPLIKKNQSITAVKAKTSCGTKKEGDTAVDKLETSALPRTSKADLPVLEPPSDMKRAVDKIVEFILRNGKEFEAVLVEQDRKYGRFPFLLPSNLYYPYYLKVLHKVEESKLPGKGFASQKHDSTGHEVDKKNPTSRESDMMYLESDRPYDSDRKEKFKMIIGKSKKDASDLPSKPAEPDSVVAVDAAAAAAILQAATRGIRNPNLECLTKMPVTGTSQGPSSDGGQVSSLGSILSSRPESSNQKSDQKGKPSVSVPVANAIAKSAAVAAASEADSSDAGLTREQKLKAERLKRAKMFAAMLKSKAEPLKQRCPSVEPPESGFSGSGAEVVNLVGREREGSSAPFDVDTSDRNEKSEKKDLGDDLERRSKRKYRSRSTRNEEDDEEEEEEIKNHKHSKKKHRSRRSSHHSRDRKRHSTSKDKDSQHHHKHDSSSDNEHRHSRRRHRHDSSDDERRDSRRRHKHDSSSDDERRDSRHRHKHDASFDDEHRHSQRRHKHDSSSDDERRHRSRSHKHIKRSHSEREVELEEGEIKSDQSKAGEGNAGSREASVDVSKSHHSREASVDLSKSWQDERDSSQPSNEVSDDLRAKIRAMLMATL